MLPLLFTHQPPGGEVCCQSDGLHLIRKVIIDIIPGVLGVGGAVPPGGAAPAIVDWPGAVHLAVHPLLPLSLRSAPALQPLSVCSVLTLYPLAGARRLLCSSPGRCDRTLSFLEVKIRICMVYVVILKILLTLTLGDSSSKHLTAL